MTRMVSSQFKSRLPFRPTPQTCYPPPPPQVDPGLLGCTGQRPGSLIQVRTTTRPTRNVAAITYETTAVDYQMAKISFDYNLWVFTARISGLWLVDVTVGLRCVPSGFMTFNWEMMAFGRVQLPSGIIVSGSIPWHQQGGNTPHPTRSLNVDGQFLTAQVTWFAANEYLENFFITWYNVPDTSRSRPPNPPIPQIG